MLVEAVGPVLDDGPAAGADPVEPAGGIAPEVVVHAPIIPDGDDGAMTTGTVAALWRHPAKSMQGEQVTSAVVGPTGVLGDRSWAVRDEERGGIRGAKKIPDLMRLRARFLEEPTPALPSPPIEIALPDGSSVRSTDDDVHDALSAALGRRVTLWPLQPPADLDHYRRGAPDSTDLDVELRQIFGRLPDEPLPDLGPFLHVLEFESPPGTYVDAYPVHVLTTASLRALQARSPGSAIDVRRFRPNAVVDLGTDPDPAGDFPEQGWVGRRLRLGEVELDVVSGCARCVMVTRPFDDLPEDRDVLRTVVRDADQILGVYANVVTPGVVRAGDAVTLV